MKTSTSIPEIKNQIAGPMAGKCSPGNINQADAQVSLQDNVFRTRVCPYCQDTIPADEDPCHHCGHLEPADIQGIDHSANNSRWGNLYFTFMAILFFFFGISMIVSPEANPQPGYFCDLPDADDCFLPYLVWSRPGGGVLIALGLAFIGWPIISRWTRRD